ncbi:flagellin hook IN motif-containing protein [Aeromonas cavernicola]|uniref:flagellin hook IN motif-containing protein n=1 Tax=Aeromonas cavernicola TaxID=1006623 RepID=UPI001F34FC9D|nr:flagellin hook IN motif-containing protein [Aeromonas cavernicola]
MTFNAGGKAFAVGVKAGDTLQTIRSRINENGNNFGLTANIIAAEGKAKLVIDSGVSGDGNNLTITGNNAELDSLSSIIKKLVMLKVLK